MFSGKKIKEHMEADRSGIFQFKLIAKNGAWVPGDTF